MHWLTFCASIVTNMAKKLEVSCRNTPSGGKQTLRNVFVWEER